MGWRSSVAAKTRSSNLIFIYLYIHRLIIQIKVKLA